MEHRDISYENQKIVDVEMGKRVQKSFIEYAMSVICLFVGSVRCV